MPDTSWSFTFLLHLLQLSLVTVRSSRVQMKFRSNKAVGIHLTLHPKNSSAERIFMEAVEVEGGRIFYPGTQPCKISYAILGPINEDWRKRLNKHLRRRTATTPKCLAYSESGRSSVLIHFPAGYDGTTSRIDRQRL